MGIKETAEILQDLTVIQDEIKLVVIEMRIHANEQAIIMVLASRLEKLL